MENWFRLGNGWSANDALESLLGLNRALNQGKAVLKGILAHPIPLGVKDPVEKVVGLIPIWKRDLDDLSLLLEQAEASSPDRDEFVRSFTEKAKTIDAEMTRLGTILKSFRA